MRIVEPSAELLFITPEAEKMIERVARTCYKSTGTNESAKRFCASLVVRGHNAMLGFAHATIRFVTDRGVSHELVRHRIAAFAQESTRYCNYSKEKFDGEITVIQPTILWDKDEYIVWKTAMQHCETAYMSLVASGVSAQIARSVLPTCLKTEICIDANFQEWRHIFTQRLAPTAHPQMRHIMALAFDLIYPQAPTIFEDFTESRSKIEWIPITWNIQHD